MRAWGVVLGVAVGLVAGCHQPSEQGGGGGQSQRPVQVQALTQPDGVADLVEATADAVVNIDTVSRTKRPHPMINGFPRGQNGRVPEIEQLERGVGSGFVIRPDGLLVTNYHVVKGANEVKVTLNDGREFPGKVIASDALTDVALVRIKAKNLPTLALASGKELRVGQYVLAMGSPLGLQHSVTMGILSAINRDIAINSRVGFLQTDAPINPGNSGGPLLNLKGEVIGINTAVAAEAQGIGFAIPVDTLHNVLTQLETTGKVSHPWLGVGVVNLPDNRQEIGYTGQGVLVGRVEADSPAARAGLKTGDVITAIEGAPVTDSAGLVRGIAQRKVGERVRIAIVRDGKPQDVALTLAPMPADVARAE